MGIFDKAKDLINEHSDKIDQGIEKAGDFIDEKTGGKYAGQVDDFQQQAKDKLDEFAGSDAPAQAASESAADSATGSTPQTPPPATV